jgi:hypothetical protein
MRGGGITFKIITLNCLHIYYDLEEYLAIIIMIEGTINYSKYRNESYILVKNIVFNLHSIPFLLDWRIFAW